MLYTLVNNVIEPSGYTILHWLASTSQTKYLKKALEINPLYIRDKDGKTPLMYSLMRRNQEEVSVFMNFLLAREKLMNQIELKELQELIIFSPPNIEDVLNLSVRTINIEEKLGVLAEERHKKFIFQQELRTDRIYNQLCVKNTEISEKKSIIFKSSRLKVVLLPGSIESMEFHQAL